MADPEDLMSRLKILEDRQRKLTDRQEIEEAIYRYCRGVDRCDVETFRSSFWPDGRFLNSAVTAPASEFVDLLIGKQRPVMFAASQHMIGNIIIDVQGDEASAETYAIAHHCSHPNRESNEAMLGFKVLAALGGDAERVHLVVIGFRYLDRLVRREGFWRILERRLVFDFNYAAPYAGIDPALYGMSTLRGASYPKDAVYGRDPLSS